MSHPTRGAWIETLHQATLDHNNDSRTPPRVRGLKRLLNLLGYGFDGRTPPGVRGLKRRSVKFTLY